MPRNVIFASRAHLLLDIYGKTAVIRLSTADPLLLVGVGSTFLTDQQEQRFGLYQLYLYEPSCQSHSGMDSSDRRTVISCPSRSPTTEISTSFVTNFINFKHFSQTGRIPCRHQTPLTLLSSPPSSSPLQAQSYISLGRFHV